MLIIKLNPGKEKKIKNGYPWIFSDEIKSIDGEKKVGELCNIFSNDYEFIGKGFYSNTNIAVRVITLKDEEINYDLFKNKIKKAIEKRKDFNESYRLIHGEADGLPGLIADKYNNFIVIQFRNVGMENYKKEILESIIELLKPTGIYERSDFETSTKEPIKRNTGVLYGIEPPEKLIIKEHKIKYYVDIKKGQKTGFFFDQRDSRLFFRSLIKKDSLVLDGYTFTGGFAFNAAIAGAKKVIGLDKDKESIEMARENAKLNNINNIEFIETRYENYIKDYQGEKFDVIVLDPPSLIKKKQERRKGVEIFKTITELSINHLKTGGILGICSCAFQADISLLIESTRRAYFALGKDIQVVGLTFQSLDHPWIIQIPESNYLKCLWFKIY